MNGLFGYENYKRRFDWGLTYYRNSQEGVIGLNFKVNPKVFAGKVITNIYMGNISYPFDRSKRLGISFGMTKR